MVEQGQSLTKIEEKTTIDLSSVVLLKCDLENDNMTDFFIKLALNETRCPIKNCNSTILDIVQAAELYKFNSSFLANSTKALNVSEVNIYNAFKNCNLTVNSILHYFNIFETTFSEIYDVFVSHLKNPVITIPNILKIVNVSSNSFLTELTFGTDLSRLQVLSTGNYSFDNIKLVMKNTSLTVTDMLSCLPLNKIVKNIEKVNSTRLSDFFNTLNVTSIDIKNFYFALNVSSNNFTNYTTFAKIRNDLDKYLNKDGTLGVFTSKTQVVTSSRAIMLQKSNIGFVLNYTTFYLQMPNSTNKYKVQNVSLESKRFVKEVAVISSQSAFLGAPSKIGLIYNATKIFNCTYVTILPNNTLTTENFNNAIVDKAFFKVIKSSKTIYTLSSPIYCQNRMYGLAVENNTQHIVFTKFKTYNITVHPTKPSPPQTPNPNSSLKLFYNFTTVLLAIFIINYFV